VSQSTYRQIGRYLVEKRVFDEDRFNRIRTFLAERFVDASIGASLGRYSNYGSCSSFEISCGQDMSASHPLHPEAIHFRLDILVSARGPFVTSWGGELQPARDDQRRPPGDDRRVMRTSAIAEARAEDVARLVAQEFGLQYLDREWLRQIRLNPRDVISDVELSLDHSEPDALNVLFSEST
jgi:hypothetical protein